MARFILWVALTRFHFGEDALFMCEPGNVEDCAAKILEIYEDPEEARLRTRTAQKALAKFDWQKQKICGEMRTRIRS